MMNLSVPRHPPVCAAYQQGKMKASPHPRVLERASRPFRTFVRLIFTQFDIVIQRWRTDGGTGEFLNSLIATVYQEFGMIHQSSTPSVKQQNGAAERRVQTLKNMECSMRAGAGVLDDYRFQAEALATAVFLMNIESSSTLDDLSPYLLLFHK
jgi:hypothetical protein